MHKYSRRAAWVRSVIVAYILNIPNLIQEYSYFMETSEMVYFNPLDYLFGIAVSFVFIPLMWGAVIYGIWFVIFGRRKHVSK